MRRPAASWSVLARRRVTTSPALENSRSATCADHPERFVRHRPQPPALPGPAWINRPEEVAPAQ
jgi:hypothetical protein